MAWSRRELALGGHALLTKLEDLDFADDIVQISHTGCHLQQKSVRINKLAEAVGLKARLFKSCPMKQPRSWSSSTTNHWTIWISSPTLVAR